MGVLVSGGSLRRLGECMHRQSSLSGAQLRRADQEAAFTEVPVEVEEVPAEMEVVLAASEEALEVVLDGQLAVVD